ncbi:hypothetical protein LQZ21_02930 [Treponema sp. TIM-1]|uniref:hypothetical protein n=1 Tax=Treponema sp. TIM-1 TaxID=2898417 RepID=UPI00398062AA
MIVKKDLFFMALWVFLPGLLFPRGNGDIPKTEEPVVSGEGLHDRALPGQLLELTGRLSLRGSEPFPEPVLTDAEGYEWHIAREDRRILAGYEQRIVTVRGRLELREMILANGQNQGTRRILSGIVLVR